MNVEGLESESGELLHKALNEVKRGECAAQGCNLGILDARLGFVEHCIVSGKCFRTWCLKIVVVSMLIEIMTCRSVFLYGAGV